MKIIYYIVIIYYSILRMNTELTKKTKESINNSDNEINRSLEIQNITASLQNEQRKLNTLINKYNTIQNLVIDEVTNHKLDLDKNIWVTSTGNLKQDADYVGVYKDNVDSAMTLLDNGQNGYSYEQCKTAAINRGSKYFGLQGSNFQDPSWEEQKYICSVSNNLANTTKYGKATIGWGMSGSPNNDVCGTSSDNNVYGGQGVVALYQAVSNEPQYAGSYNDNPNRSVPIYKGYNTWDECKNIAINENYKYFGRQCGNNQGYGQCFVGNDWERAVSLGEVPVEDTLSGCEIGTYYKDIDGNMMGGGWANAVYAVPSKEEQTQTPKYLGCYLNDSYDSAMIETGDGTPESTITECNKLATASGYKYFGVSDKNEDGNVMCYLSNDLDQAKRDGVANPYRLNLSGKMVGSKWVNAVYQLNDANNEEEANLVGKLGYVDKFNILKEYPASMITYEWIVKSNTNSPLNTIKEVSGNSLDTCKEMAMGMNDCFGFTYNNNNKSCAFKTVGITQDIFKEDNYTDEGTDLYIKNPIVQNNKSCTKKITEVHSSEWNSKSKGDPMEMTYLCGLAESISDDKKELLEIQKEMTPIVRSIETNINTLKSMNVDMTKLSGIDKTLLDENINTYKELSNKIKKNLNANIYGNNVVNDSQIVSKSMNYSFYIWITILILVSIIIFRTIK